MAECEGVVALEAKAGASRSVLYTVRGVRAARGATYGFPPRTDACFEGVRCERQQARGGGPRWLNIFVFLAQVTTSRRAIGPAIASACCMCCGNRACIPISHCIDSARHPNTQPQPSHHGSLTDARGKLVLVLRTQHCRPAGLAHTRADTSPNCSGLPRRRLARFAMRACDADQSYSISPRRATTTSGLATLQRQTFASCQHVSRQLTHCIELPRQSLARFAMRGYEHDHAHIAQPRHRHRLTGHGMSHARRRAGGTCTATSHAQLRTPHMSAQCHAHVRCIARTSHGGGTSGARAQRFQTECSVRYKRDGYLSLSALFHRLRTLCEPPQWLV